MTKQKIITILVIALFFISFIVMIFTLKNASSPSAPHQVIFEQYNNELTPQAEIAEEINSIAQDEEYLNEIDNAIEEESNIQEINTENLKSSSNNLNSNSQIFDINDINKELQSFQNENELNDILEEESYLKEINL